MNRRCLIALALLAVSIAAHAAPLLYHSSDVPTDPGTGVYQLPWQAFIHDSGLYSPVPVLDVPGPTPLSALHRMDTPGNWLFVPAAPGDLGGALPSVALPHDVVRCNGATYSHFFCGGAVPDPIPLGIAIDAIFLDPDTGGDRGHLIVSFDTPIELPGGSGIFYDRADLVRYVRTGPGCGDWGFVGPEFDASSAGAGIPPSSNVIGASTRGDKLLLVFDVPTSLAPSPAPPFYVPGDVASWDGAAFDHFDSLTAWPLASRVDGLSCSGNPGAVALGAAALLLDKTVTGDVELAWPKSCSQGAEDYAVYEGAIGDFSSHQSKLCSTAGTTTATLTPAPGDTYYLVVPHNFHAEGSFGRDSSGSERPRPSAPADQCLAVQTLKPCP